MTTLTMGSLFDGSGGFPLGALLNGITPLWASEIEPFPIRITTKRLPFMKHCGDICGLNGAELEPVDIITFGSPCTNLSIAGRREGLEGKQSSLFHQAIRIIHEMRCATNGEYPRFIVWENVPGAYSSSGGGDFLQVLSEIVKIKDEAADVPVPEKAKWLSAGEIVADGFSLAWRTLDAQFWGVAQRRRRCYLVADFAGECAGKILFEFESLSGYTPQGYKAGQTTACDFERGAGAAGAGATGADIPVLNARSRNLESANNRAYSLASTDFKGTQVVYDARGNGSGQIVSTITGDHNGHISDYTALVVDPPTDQLVPHTLKIRSGCEGGGKGALVQVNKSATLSGNNEQTVFVPFGKGTRPHSVDEEQRWEQKEVANTLNTFDVGAARCNEVVVQAYGICAAYSGAMLSENPNVGYYPATTSRTVDKNAGNPTCNQGGIAVVEPNMPQGPVAYDCRNHCVSDVSGTLQAKSNGGQSLNYINPVAMGTPQYTVRRLIPCECAMLQGFPRDWCDNLDTKNPTEADIAWWSSVFETHRKAVGVSTKPKSPAQVTKWLQNPYSDSAEYKMWGNGVALPCVCFVMAGIKWAAFSSAASRSVQDSQDSQY